jgi:hypothetical protein
MSGVRASTAPARRALLGWLLAYAGLLLVVYAVYGRTLGQFFIADDFTNLLYFSDGGAPLWRWLDPAFRYSDPVTHARYVPGRVYLMLLLVRCFGLEAARYHALALLVHAGNALLVGHLGRALSPARGARETGALAALLFATARVDAQGVCWASCLPALVGTSLLFGSGALYLARGRGALPRVLGPVLLFASLFLRTDATVSLAFFASLWVRDAIVEKSRAARAVALIGLAGAGAYEALTWISLRCFPEPHMALGLSPGRFYAFFADLFAPFEAPAAVKAAVVVGVVAASATLGDRRVLCALYGIALGALFWAVVTYLALMPRYLYAHACLSSVLLAALLRRACEELLGARPAPRAALFAGVVLCAWSAWEVRRREVVWFDYLSTPGAALLRLRERQRAAGATAPLRVRMAPYPLLIVDDSAFFSPYLEIVRDEGDAVDDAVVLDTGAARFASYYGEDFGPTLWYFPWFVR